MNKKELAEQLNGREYRAEVDELESNKAAEAGLVVVFGASDDLMEFRGKIYDEIGAWDGGTAYFKDGQLITDEDERAVLEKHGAKFKTIEAIWSPEDNEGNTLASWHYKTEIPHETFTIMEDGEVYCVGIVFDYSDLLA